MTLQQWKDKLEKDVAALSERYGQISLTQTQCLQALTTVQGRLMQVKAMLREEEVNKDGVESPHATGDTEPSES